MSGRPESLWPLFGALDALDGIGPKTAKTLAAARIETPRDMLYTLPHSGIDRRLRPSVQDVPPGDVVTVEVTVGRHWPPQSRGRPYRVSVTDASLEFQLVFFHAKGDWLQKQLPTGQKRIVSGKLEHFDGIAQIVHPDHMLAAQDADEIPPFEPVYPLTGGVTQKLMWRATRSALEKAPDLDEWIDPPLFDRQGWSGWKTAMTEAHSPQSTAELGPTSHARQRLAYDEFLAHQLTLALARSNLKRGKGRSTAGNGALRHKVLGALPYSPTGAQSRTIAEIEADMSAKTRMSRLLQGDVGAGKTLVAFMALLIAVESGGQGR